MIQVSAREADGRVAARWTGERAAVGGLLRDVAWVSGCALPDLRGVTNAWFEGRPMAPLARWLRAGMAREAAAAARALGTADARGVAGAWLALPERAQATLAPASGWLRWLAWTGAEPGRRLEIETLGIAASRAWRKRWDVGTWYARKTTGRPPGWAQ